MTHNQCVSLKWFKRVQLPILLSSFPRSFICPCVPMAEETFSPPNKGCYVHRSRPSASWFRLSVRLGWLVQGGGGQKNKKASLPLHRHCVSLVHNDHPFFYSNHEPALFVHCEHKGSCGQHLFKRSGDEKKSFVYVSVNLFARSLCTRADPNKIWGKRAPVALTWRREREKNVLMVNKTGGVPRGAGAMALQNHPTFLSYPW